MAGYSGTPLWKKLGIKPAHVVLLVDAPKGFKTLLEPVPEGVEFLGSVKPGLDVAVVFCPSKAALLRHYDGVKAALRPTGGFWVAWPKKSSGVKTDMDENAVRDLALSTGLVDNKVCAVDETWSALRLVVRVKDRPGTAG